MNEENSGMKKLGEVLKNKAYPSPQEKKKGPNHIRSEQVTEVMKLMKDERYGYWNGRTKHLTPREIYIMRKSAEEGRIPQALFNHLLKKSK